MRCAAAGRTPTRARAEEKSADGNRRRSSRDSPDLSSPLLLAGANDRAPAPVLRPVPHRCPGQQVREMAECLCSLSAADVAEIFSPPRITPKAHLYGLRSRFCSDLTTQNCKGEYWDLSREDHQRELERLQKTERPALLTGSPPCTDFCKLLNQTQQGRDRGPTRETW